jgi:arginyl-tRNA synthetase
MIEYTDPNPFKELHIGHIVPNSVGVSLSRIFQFCAADVREVTFQGDVGLHIAKAMYGMKKLGFDMDIDFTAQDLGKAYAEGSKFYESDIKIQEEIKDLNKRIFEIYTGEETEMVDIYEKGKKVSLDYFEKVYEVLNSNFVYNFFESATGFAGKNIVEENIPNVFTKSKGAVIFDGEKYGLHTRVFINAQNLPTYETKDIGLVKMKHD